MDKQRINSYVRFIFHQTHSEFDTTCKCKCKRIFACICMYVYVYIQTHSHVHINTEKSGLSTINVSQVERIRDFYTLEHEFFIFQIYYQS